MSGTLDLGKYKDFLGNEYELTLLNSCGEFYIYPFYRKEDGTIIEDEDNLIEWEHKYVDNNANGDYVYAPKDGLLYNMMCDLVRAKEELEFLKEDYKELKAMYDGLCK